MKRIGFHWLATAAIVALALGAPQAAKARPKVRLTERLAAAASAPAARGRARLVLKSDEEGWLRIAVRGLEGDAAYEVVIDGVRVVALETNRGGNGRVRFSTDPGRRDALLGVDPRGKTVAIRDATGTDVLSGAIEDGPDDPAAVACCLAEADDDSSDGESDGESDGDGETDGDAGASVRHDLEDGDSDDASEDDEKCLDLTPERCTAEGGIVLDAESCIPDPCEDEPMDAIVCCLPGGSPDGAFLHAETGEDCHVGCERTTSAECAAVGGTVVEADSCEPNPCEPAPPVEEGGEE